MQKYDFQYRQDELDELHLRSIYEGSYEEAIKDFISGTEVIFSQGWRYDVFGSQAKKILNQYIYPS